MEKTIKELFIWIAWFWSRAKVFIVIGSIFEAITFCVAFQKTSAMLLVFILFLINGIFIGADFIFGSQEKNWRIASDKGLMYALEHFLDQSRSFLLAEEKARELRDSSFIIKWMKHHQQFLRFEKELSGLKERFRKKQGTTSQKKINQIEAAEARLRFLKRKYDF